MYEARLRQLQYKVEILYATCQAPKNYIEQGRVDRGTGI